MQLRAWYVSEPCRLPRASAPGQLQLTRTKVSQFIRPFPMTTERPATKLHVMRMLLKYYNVFKTSRDSVQVLSAAHSADIVNVKPKVY